MPVDGGVQPAPVARGTGVAARRKVLLLTQDLDVWGAQRQIVELAQQLDPRRYDVRMGTLERRGPLLAELADLGLPVETFERRWRWDLSPVLRLARYLRRERIDIVHSFLFLPNFYARFAGVLAGTPAVISSLRSTGIEGWHRYLLDIATCFLCSKMIANSDAGREHYVRRGGPARKIVVVRNGLSERRSRQRAVAGADRPVWDLPAIPLLVGMVGALESRKDQRTLIRAMKQVCETVQGAGLVLAGEGSFRQQLVDEAAELGTKVVFLGKIEDPERLYPRLTVYTQASRHSEGISNSILEAMSHGLPVVASDIGGNAEAVDDGRTGFIVPPGDVAAMAAALQRLLTDADLRSRMGQAAAERVRSLFTLERMVAETEAVYDSLLGPSPAGP